MTDTPKRRAFIVRNFTDEGTGESFTKGATPLLDAGVYGNYEAAGLVTAPPVTKASRAPKPAAQPKDKPKAKPKGARAPAAAKVPAQPAVAPTADASADA